MISFLILFSIIIFACIFLNKVSMKLGVPVLLLFLLLGVFFGWQDSEFATDNGWLVNEICTAALIFIMFYGGFGTRWKSARPIVVEAGILATLGVALTALLVGLFCHFVMKWGWIESLLMGSVISSTDAASVFSILRSHKLGLKGNTAPLLEMESGSNDPMSYMLTTVMLTLLGGKVTAGMVIWDIFAQLVFGAACGLVIAQIAVFFLRRVDMSGNGYDSLFLVAVALMAYAIPNLLGGNGYLSAYIVGIILGNTKYKGRKALIAFFDGVTDMMQILIFFLLGMMAVPEKLLHAIVPSLIIFVFLLLVARPLAVGGILAPFGKFKKYPLRDMGFISFVGLRGAASIVFAIMILTQGEGLANDIFSIVFCIVIISIGLQGTLIPWAAKAFKMVDEEADVMKTFSDFRESADVTFGRLTVASGGPWDGKMLKDMVVPKDVLVVSVKHDGKIFVPKGNTVFHAGDDVVFCSHDYSNDIQIDLIEHPVSSHSEWIGKTIGEHPDNSKALVVMIRRGDEEIIPNGNTVIEAGDVLVLLKK